MPKPSKYPKLRASIKRGKAGQVWTSYWYDMRGTGKPDVALGNDYTEALRRWAEIALDAPRIAGTLEEAFRAWETAPDGLQGPRIGAETRKGYTKCLRMIRPVFGPARWSDVTFKALKTYVEQRTAKTRAKQEMQLLSVIWGWARTEDMTDLPYPAADMQRSQWKGPTGRRQVEVSDAAFEALHRHADATLRDALDIATATGLRVMDVLALRLSDVRGGELVSKASKTGKHGDYDLSASAVLLPIIERRRAMRGVEHVFLLAAGRRPVTYRMLADRFDKARAAAMIECPECAGLWLRDMRKRAAMLSGSLAAASKLLQHSSLSVTSQHYRQGDKLKPVR
jgi:integrase